MLASQQKQANAKETLVASGVFSRLHCCWAALSCIGGAFRVRAVDQSRGSERVSRGEQPARIHRSAASAEAPGSLLGLRARAGSAWSSASSSFSVKGCRLNHTNSSMMETRPRRLKARRLSLLFISTCWGYSKHSRLQPLSQRWKYKRRGRDK